MGIDNGKLFKVKVIKDVVIPVSVEVKIIKVTENLKVLATSTSTPNGRIINGTVNIVVNGTVMVDVNV